MLKYKTTIYRTLDLRVKDALAVIQKRFHNPNPHVAHHALLVLEACVKNCGKKVIFPKENTNSIKMRIIHFINNKLE